VSTAPQTSLTAHVMPIEIGGHVLRCGFIKDQAALVLADGGLAFIDGTSLSRHTPHGDAAILTAHIQHDLVLTGGEDGRVISSRPDGSSDTLAHEKGRWIDALTASAQGAMAWSTGKIVFARDSKGEIRKREAPSTVQGLSFLPKGYRLAYSHYNGASLWFPNSEATPEPLDWKGSHIDISASPDGRFVVTSMQENTLHGWRLSDKKDMRMSGYPAKIRSFSWSHDGEWLATSGAEAAVIWPFKEKDGPMGKPPRECGVRPAKVTQVAFHPNALVLAIGYEDNCILLCRLTDAAELLVRVPVRGQGAITSMAWDKRGKQLVFGTSEGAAGVLTLP
jgi:WD40 repeat protein